ncbi:histidinol-phosphate transaminase [Solilutibacter silvestris]|uniref:Histidinol-phosphate aminotransferase n=1 Tax=Solilutibacter silvestris TaxID=1645665 RepID=A0A2K1PYH4_9GAMM|nr:histidinol-phosphate transaminase [Lysobacter silvestris]PNS07844.1 hisC: histidinol-phosphate transaminase [Lysobacter silvestris]
MLEHRVQPAIRGLRAYDPGHDMVALRRAADAALVELGSNENPYGPSPLARDAVVKHLDELALYPDPRGGDLKRALAQRHGVAVEQIVLGDGSHELLMQLAQVFAGPDAGVVASQYGFAVYSIAAAAVGAPFRAAPALAMDHAMAAGHDLDAIVAAVDANTHLVYLANPNNPTGTWCGIDAIERFLARIPDDVIVAIDEAYAEFVDAPEWASAIALVARHSNLIVLRTFSKAHGLAGLRVGYGIAQPELIGWLERVRESFNVNLLGLAAAEASLGDPAHVGEGVRKNKIERERLADALRSRGLFVFPSQTNFLLVRFGEDAARIDEALRTRGIVPRPMGGYGLPDCLRITIGTADQNATLLAALDALR